MLRHRSWNVVPHDGSSYEFFSDVDGESTVLEVETIGFGHHFVEAYQTMG
jgi:hypothetical protein